MPTAALSPADLRNYVGVGKQSVLGTGVVPSRSLAYVGPVSFLHNPNIRDVREAGGGGVIARQVKDYLAPGAELAVPVRPELGAVLAGYFFGVAGAPSGGGDPYTHTITQSLSNVNLSIERNIADDTIERVIDAIFTSLTFDLRKRDQGPEIMMALTAEGGVETAIAAATTEVYEAERPFLRSDCTWTIDGNAATNVESATLDFSWAIDATMLADGITRVALAKLHLTAAIEVTQIFNSTQARTDYLTTHYGTTTAATPPGETVYAGDFNVAMSYDNGSSNERSITIDVPVVNWGDAVLSDNNPEASEVVKLTRRGVMVANPGGEPVTITALNGLATAIV